MSIPYPLEENIFFKDLFHIHNSCSKNFFKTRNLKNRTRSIQTNTWQWNYKTWDPTLVIMSKTKNLYDFFLLFVKYDGIEYDFLSFSNSFLDSGWVCLKLYINRKLLFLILFQVTFNSIFDSLQVHQWYQLLSNRNELKVSLKIHINSITIRT